MNAADRILLSLDAHECLAGALDGWRTSTARASEVEPIMIRHEGSSDFGSIGGQQTVADLQDILSSWDYRMQQLAASYNAIASAWQARDPSAYAAWTADWNALQSRYNAAVSAANSAVLIAKLNPFTPNSVIPAQAEYDGLMKAMRQCYPPDGCTIRKGDFDDVLQRLNGGAASVNAPAPSFPNMPQPKASDVDQRVFAATAPIDPVAQLTGAQAGGPIPSGLIPTGGWLAWLQAHKKALIIGGVVLVGGIVLIELKMLVAAPLAAAKGLAALA